MLTLLRATIAGVLLSAGLMAVPSTASATERTDLVSQVLDKTVTADQPAMQRSLRGAPVTFLRQLASDPQGFDCDLRHDHDTAVHDNLLTTLKLYYGVWAFYRYCWPDDPDRYEFAEPTHTRVSYNLQGDHFNCDAAVNNELTYVEVNWYFWRPYTGQNWNPGSYNIPCDDSTMNAASQYYDLDDVPRLYFGPGDRAPHWKVNLTRHRVGPDGHTAISHRFKP